MLKNHTLKNSFEESLFKQFVAKNEFCQFSIKKECIYGRKINHLKDFLEKFLFQQLVVNFADFQRDISFFIVGKGKSI